MSHPSRIESIADARTFLTAGKATFTLVSKRTGSRFTYMACKGESDRVGVAPIWVKLLSGPDNTSDYQFMGTLWVTPDGNADFRTSKRTEVDGAACSMKAFLWLCAMLFGDAADRFDQCEFWHEGRCCRCGRKLTVPSSIASGIGPECASKMEA